MVRFGGISSKIKSRVCCVALAGAILLTGTGCTGPAVDAIRPEINIFKGLILTPEIYEESAAELMEEDGTTETGGGIEVGFGAGEAVGENVGEGTGITLGNTGIYAAIPQNVVTASTYSKYLDQEIYTPVSTIIQALPVEAQDQIYFRVFHKGYDFISDAYNQVAQAGVFDVMRVGAMDAVGGTLVSEFALQWLRDVNSNSVSISRRRNAYGSLLDNCHLSANTSWAAIDHNTVDWTVTTMWGNTALNENQTEQDYYQKIFTRFRGLVNRQIIGVIPNLELKVYLNSKRSGYIKLNEVTRDDVCTYSVSSNGMQNMSVYPYENGMKMSSVERLFTQYNQYTTRNAVTKTLNESDAQSILWSYVDGHSKTIVLLAVERGDTLENVLGDKLPEVEAIISNTLPYTSWTEIPPIVGMEEEVTTILKDTEVLD